MSSPLRLVLAPVIARLQPVDTLTHHLEIDVVGPEDGVAFLPLEEIDRLLSLALASAGIESGHVAVEFVAAERIAELNAQHRGTQGPTDVLSFPVDGGDPSPGPCELGDIVICPEHTADLEEDVVHGILHLCGHDHETDDGEMLTLQAQILRELHG